MCYVIVKWLLNCNIDVMVLLVGAGYRREKNRRCAFRMKF